MKEKLKNHKLSRFEDELLIVTTAASCASFFIAIACLMVEIFK